MVCSGLSGTQIADNWRKMNPFDLVGFNWKEFHKLFWARSIATQDGLRAKVFPEWGLDWDKIRSCREPVGTFNIYNFTEKKLHVFENSRLDEDFLCAAVALPMWFPPVERDGQTWFDAGLLHRLERRRGASGAAPMRCGRSGPSRISRSIATASSRSISISSRHPPTRHSFATGMRSRPSMPRSTATERTNHAKRSTCKSETAA